VGRHAISTVVVARLDDLDVGEAGALEAVAVRAATGNLIVATVHMHVLIITVAVVDIVAYVADVLVETANAVLVDPIIQVVVLIVAGGVMPLVAERQLCTIAFIARVIVSWVVLGSGR